MEWWKGVHTFGIMSWKKLRLIHKRFSFETLSLQSYAMKYDYQEPLGQHTRAVHQLLQSIGNLQWK